MNVCGGVGKSVAWVGCDSEAEVVSLLDLYIYYE